MKKDEIIIVGVFLLLIFLIFTQTSDNFNGSKTTEEPEKTGKELEQAFNEELEDDLYYEVGKDLPAGEYYLESTDEHGGSYELVANKSNIFNGVMNQVQNSEFITLEEGDSIKFSNLYIQPVSEVEIIPPYDGVYTEGAYRVGIDIPAGEYYIKPDEEDNGRYAIKADSSGDPTSIVDSAEVTGEEVIVLKEGQYFNFSNALVVETTENKNPENGVYTPGTYEVGSELPAGEYYIEPNTGTSAKYEISGDKGLYTYNSFVSDFVTLEAGQSFSFRDAKIRPASEVESLAPDDGVYTDGSYRVGTDIPAGEYYIEPTIEVGDEADLSKYLVKSDSIKIVDGKIPTTEIIYPKFVMLEEGEYLWFENAVVTSASEPINVETEDGVYPSGAYRVGIDIPAGEYKIESEKNNAEARYSIYEDPYVLSKPLEFERLGSQRIYKTELEDGQYIVLTNAQMTKVE